MAKKEKEERITWWGA